MVKKKKKAIIRKVKDISISGALTLALLGGTAGLPSCDESEESSESTVESTEEMVNEEVFTKSVQTHITEVSPRVFRITDEHVIEEEGKSKAIISYLNGKIDTLTVEQAREIVEKQHQADSLRALTQTDSTKNIVDTTAQKHKGLGAKTLSNTHRTGTNSTANYSSGDNYSSSGGTGYDHHYNNPNYSYHNTSHYDNSLGTMLMVGGLGYMMGSSVTNYRTRYIEDADRRYSRSGSGGSSGTSGYTGTSRYYSNPSAHAKTQTTHSTLKSSRVTVSRPASSRSGYFSRSSGSSSGSSSTKSSSSSSSSRSSSSFSRSSGSS